MHINVVINKTSKSLGIISKARHLIPQSASKMLYMTLVEPYFNYCNIIWASFSETTNLEKLLKIQKKYCRLITFSDFREHSNPLFTNLNILNIYNINKLQIAIYMYKAINNRLPASDIFCFRQNSTVHSHATRHKDKLHKEYARTKLRQDTVRFQGPELWNSLSTELKNFSPISRFKRELKIFLVQQQAD
jgi:hypothetical protein